MSQQRKEQKHIQSSLHQAQRDTDSILKISGNFNDVLKAAVSDNPKSKKQTTKKS